MNTLKLLHAADFHLDSDFSALSPEAAEARRKLAREILPRFADAARSLGVQAVILSGDIFENNTPSPETQRELCRSLGSLDMPVFLASGNHDPFFPGSVWSRMQLPENVQFFNKERIVCAEYPELNARFWGAGFERSFCPPLLEGFEAPEKIDGVFDIMVLHGDLGSGESDYCRVSRAELEKSGMDYVAMGHIHQRSELEHAGATAFAYPGVPEGRGYDELGVKGCYLVTLSKDGVSADFIPLGKHRYEILTADVSGTAPLQAVKNAVEGFSSGDYLRIILTGETEDAPDIAAIRRELQGSFAELQIIDETHIKRDVWAALGRDDLAGLFLRKLADMRETAVTGSEREKIELAAAYGIAALEDGGRAL